MLTANHGAIGFFSKRRRLRWRNWVIHRGSPFHHEIWSTTPWVEPLAGVEGVFDLVAPAEVVLAEIEVERRHRGLLVGCLPWQDALGDLHYRHSNNSVPPCHLVACLCRTVGSRAGFRVRSWPATLGRHRPGIRDECAAESRDGRSGGPVRRRASYDAERWVAPLTNGSADRPGRRLGSRAATPMQSSGSSAERPNCRSTPTPVAPGPIRRSASRCSWRPRPRWASSPQPCSGRSPSRSSALNRHTARSTVSSVRHPCTPTPRPPGRPDDTLRLIDAWLTGAHHMRRERTPHRRRRVAATHRRRRKGAANPCAASTAKVASARSRRSRRLRCPRVPAGPSPVSPSTCAPTAPIAPQAGGAIAVVGVVGSAVGAAFRHTRPRRRPVRTRRSGGSRSVRQEGRQGRPSAKPRACSTPSNAAKPQSESPTTCAKRFRTRSSKR